MQSKEVSITGEVINVTLSEDTNVLDEVVVTGYGTTKNATTITTKTVEEYQGAKKR